MFEEEDSEINLKNKIINNDKINIINDRYSNIDINPISKNKNNSVENAYFFNYDNNDEDLDIELEAVSKIIPLENFGIIKEQRFVKLENNNKISPLQRKKRSKIHRHKSYDNWHNHNIVKDNENNNNINYTKINNHIRNTPNIKITNNNMRREFNEQNENLNNKTDYDLFRGNNNRQYENDTDKNTIDTKINKVSYFRNFTDKIDIDNENIEMMDIINEENKNSFKNKGNANLINLKAVHNNNNNNYFINFGKEETQNIINKKEELDKNIKNIFKQIDIDNINIQKDENKPNDDESLVQKIENKLRNKFEVDEDNSYFNRTPNIKNNSIHYFDNDFVDKELENKDKYSNNNDIVFKPTNIIKSGKEQNEYTYNYSKDKIQHNKFINQIKKLKEENRALKSRNEKLSEKILQIEREQKKKNNNEYSLLQKIKKLENQLYQKNKIISKNSKRNNFNCIRQIKIISFFIRNRNSNMKYQFFKNLKVRNVENIRFFPDYLKDSEIDKEDSDIFNIEENINISNNRDEKFEEDDEINNIVNKREEFNEEDENEEKNIKKNKKIVLKKNKSNKVFSSIINNIQNNYKNIDINSNNNTITINKIYQNNKKYNYSLPVSNKKESKNNTKKSIYEFFEKSSSNKSITSNKNNNNKILSKKSIPNKYNQNYNINFYKNNCYNNNFVSLFQNEEDNKKKINTNNFEKEKINNKKEKQKTSLIMSVLNDNLLGNMNFDLVNTNITNNKI